MALVGDEAPVVEQGYQLQSQHYYKIVTSYMPESFEQDAIQIALVAVDKYRQLKDIAFYIKHEYDKKYPGSGKATEGVYHCIVGKSFASSVSHETRQFIHMKVDTYHVILWKSKDTPFTPGGE
ncbi:Dynein light chain, flagellar outer arm [Tetrabaena socialis]|uniref:Dynein light chain n=1 Tax=Tetrabaena socialis TaxID=47790 RepID=A0A2J7ZXP6_9CHLO|nr:Dynein light chain, flagellar outer arm [Tetrabaena socialis]|eukprot:PNH05047.1 Dynein light chain, flagellar outer arm [Tetrabaena socialis]